MALEKTVSTSRIGNITFGNAYFRIVGFSLTRKRGGGTQFSIDVSTYASAPEHEDVQEINFFRYHGESSELPQGTWGNPIEQAYAWLKAKQEFSDAIDV